MTNTRRGFTMVELLVAMVMLAVVGVAMYSLLINSQRIARRQVERTDLQGDVRAGSLILPAELREIGYDSNGTDLREIGTNRIRFRAMRGVGLTCGVTADYLYLVTPIFGDAERVIKTTDTLLVFVDKNQDQAADDQWVAKAILEVQNTTCPLYPTKSAIRVKVGGVNGNGNLSGHLAPNPVTLFTGGPVRIYDLMELGLYVADGKSWLGAKSVGAGEVYQPVLGPLASDTGVRFTYYNAANTPIAVTGDRTLIRNIRIDLYGNSDEPVWTGRGNGKPVIDTLSLTARVALRNNTRP